MAEFRSIPSIDRLSFKPQPLSIVSDKASGYSCPDSGRTPDLATMRRSPDRPSRYSSHINFTDYSCSLKLEYVSPASWHGLQQRHIPACMLHKPTARLDAQLAWVVPRAGRAWIKMCVTEMVAEPCRSSLSYLDALSIKISTVRKQSAV